MFNAPDSVTNFVRIRSFLSGKDLTTSVNGWFDQPIVQLPDDLAQNQQWFPVVEDNQQFFVNRQTGFVIDAIGGVLAANVQIQQFPFNGGANQRWTVRPTDDFPNNQVPIGQQDTFVVEAVGTNLAWDIPNASGADGVQIQVFPQNGAGNQAWRFRPFPVQHTVRIRSAASNLFITLPLFSPDDGVEFEQWPGPDPGQPLHFFLNQIWVLEDLGNGSFIIRSLTSGKVWDHPLQLPDQPALVGQYAQNNGQNQAWRIQDLPTGFVRIIPETNLGFSLDLPNGTPNAGAHVQQYPDHGGLNQQWDIIRVDM
jgi:hypothetical protein